MKQTPAMAALLVWGFGAAAMGQSVQVGTMAPAPALLALSGDSYRFLSELYYEGNDRPGARRSAAVLNFMSQDSASSAESLPLFMAVARKVQSHDALRGQVRFFLVVADPFGQTSRLSLYLDRHRVGTPVDVLLDPRRKACKLFGVDQLPRTFVISRSGILVADVEGTGGDYSKELAKGIVKAIRSPESAPKPDRAAAGGPLAVRDSAAAPDDDPAQPMRW